MENRRDDERFLSTIPKIPLGCNSYIITNYLIFPYYVKNLKSNNSPNRSKVKEENIACIKISHSHCLIDNFSIQQTHDSTESSKIQSKYYIYLPYEKTMLNFEAFKSTLKIINPNIEEICKIKENEVNKLSVPYLDVLYQRIKLSPTNEKTILIELTISLYRDGYVKEISLEVKKMRPCEKAIYLIHKHNLKISPNFFFPTIRESSNLKWNKPRLNVMTEKFNKLGKIEQRLIFGESLSTFMAECGQSRLIEKPLYLGSKQVDIFKLYYEVIKRGGMDMVTACSLWKDVYNQLDLCDAGTSASYNTRSDYKRLLYRYELANYDLLCDDPSKFKFDIGEYVKIERKDQNNQLLYAQIANRRLSNQPNEPMYYINIQKWKTVYSEWASEKSLSKIQKEEYEKARKFVTKDLPRTTKYSGIFPLPTKFLDLTPIKKIINSNRQKKKVNYEDLKCNGISRDDLVSLKLKSGDEKNIKKILISYNHFIEDYPMDLLQIANFISQNPYLVIKYSDAVAKHQKKCLAWNPLSNSCGKNLISLRYNSYELADGLNIFRMGDGNGNGPWGPISNDESQFFNLQINFGKKVIKRLLSSFDSTGLDPILFQSLSLYSGFANIINDNLDISPLASVYELCLAIRTQSPQIAISQIRNLNNNERSFNREDEEDYSKNYQMNYNQQNDNP